MNRIETFLFIGQCLAPVDQPDDGLGRIIANREVNWELALSIGSQHFVLPLLFWRLRRKNLLGLAPQDVQDCLTGTYELNLLRNQELRAQIGDLAQVLNRIKIEPVLLKGANALFLNWYDDAGLRMMTDVDILVQEESLTACVDALKRRGYRENAAGDARPAQFHHYAPLVCDDYSTAVELHTHAVHHPFTHLLPTEEVYAQAQPVDTGGQSIVRAPSQEHFIVNNVIRSQLSRQGRDMVRLYHLYDIVMLRRAGDDKVDWQAIRERFEREGYGTSIRLHLLMIERLFGQTCPAEIPPTMSARLQWRGLLWSLGAEWRFKAWRTLSYIGASLQNLRRRPDLRRKLLRPAEWTRRYRHEIKQQIHRDIW